MPRLACLLVITVIVASACGTATGRSGPEIGRTAAIYAALIDKLLDSAGGAPVSVDATATSSAGAQETKPAGRYRIPLRVQRQVKSAVRVPLRFVTAPEEKQIWSRGGALLTLGLVPPQGDRLIVGGRISLGNTGTTGSNFRINRHGDGWRVDGDTGIGIAS